MQTAALLATFLILAWFILFWSITRRLRRLNSRVDQFRQNSLAPQMPVAGGDEISQLDATFAQMREPKAVKVSVSDTGCGIPQGDLPYIFDRFYKARNVDIENAQGAGLGLAIAKRILELHGSMIHAESVINVGTTFAFSLPTTEFKA